MSGSRVQRRGFVGRAAEFERLESALRTATAGGGGTVLVAGEAGIGKTRLVAELTEHARRAGAAVLSGRCIDLVGTGVPYLALADALRSVPGSPLLTDLPAASNGPRPQVQLLLRVRAALEQLAAEAPLVLVGEPDQLTTLFESADLRIDRFDTWIGATELDSIDTLLAVELLPIADQIDDAVRDRITRDARTALAPFVDHAGAVSAPIEVHLITAHRT